MFVGLFSVLLFEEAMASLDSTNATHIDPLESLCIVLLCYYPQTNIKPSLAGNLVCKSNEISESPVCHYRIEGSSFRILPFMLLLPHTGLCVWNVMPPPRSPLGFFDHTGFPHFVIFLRS